MTYEIYDNKTTLFEVGDVVEEDGFYVCVPCGSKKYFKKGTQFPSCLNCMNQKARKMLAKDLELWERVYEN